MAARIRTGRGDYRIEIVGEPVRTADSIELTIALESLSGIERVGFRCRVAARLSPDGQAAESIVGVLAPWIEREFEATREAALRSIRAEKRLLEVVFDEPNLGTFR